MATTIHTTRLRTTLSTSVDATAAAKVATAPTAKANVMALPTAADRLRAFLPRC
ncbi:MULTISPECIES: hypothetical protein [Streptomyces]|uniref:FXSXX-COOH protein n=1 Tax=Streptomyces doudnae TaxID=3075536 RepID=A0ABD5EQY9_9ACTN|nr:MULTISPECIES: hypothetical protein [unclassified Streptomyces]MDT0436454.1 hypothetical protein [Streptomyces sp. DSM 41981]MYQ65921.1 hypothetical protein [Streptomyces sp. SID4950]